MVKRVKQFTSKLGIDESISYTVISRLIQAFGGLFTLFLVASNLTITEQGYYYTFGSILAIQIFFELGLSNIITQFVAHENAHLIWNDSGSFSGSNISSSRLSSLLRFTFRWYLIIGILLFFGLIFTGNYFFQSFGSQSDFVEWKYPWMILAITTTLSLIVSPFLAFFEGLGKVRQVAKMRFFQQLTQLFLVIVFFTSGFKLFASPIASLFSFLLIVYWIFRPENKRILFIIWRSIDKYRVNYKEEIFPYQWKIAISWISGYFIFQLFNPVLFATEGAIVAGQMGMTLGVLNAILMLTLSWINTKVPTFSMLIAKKEYVKLDLIFNKALRQSTYLNIFFMFFFLFGIIMIRYYNLKIGNKNIGDRFLSYLPMISMMFPIFLNHLISAWATYLRSHKKEPLLYQSLVVGILCSLSTLFLGNKFGVIGISVGYMFVTVISFIWTYYIFITKKKQWHYE